MRGSEFLRRKRGGHYWPSTTSPRRSITPLLIRTRVTHSRKSAPTQSPVITGSWGRCPFPDRDGRARQKVAQTAAERKVSPQELVDAVAESTREIWSLLGISYDQFIRTTDPAHKAGVKRLIEQIFDNSPNDFYEKSYEGWYCVGCESFKQDNEIVDGKCILHPTRTLEWVKEKNWFFVSALTDRIGSSCRREFLQPRSRRNEILSLLDSGLEDVSASRSASPGAFLPAPGHGGVRRPSTSGSKRCQAWRRQDFPIRL